MMNYGGSRNPKQIAAIAENYKDKEKLVKPPKPPTIKPIKAPMAKMLGKGKAASVPAAPAFGRKRLYGTDWS